MSFRTELTYLSHNDNDYCSIELTTTDNTQAKWEDKSIDLDDLLKLFNIDKTDINGEDTVEVRSFDNDNPPSTETVCYQLEAEIVERDEEHGTSELEIQFIEDNNITQVDGLSNIECIHQYCLDNKKWDDWYECLSG